MAENLYVLGCVSWKSPQFSGHSRSLYSRAGICSYIFVRMSLPTDATTTRLFPGNLCTRMAWLLAELTPALISLTSGTNLRHPIWLPQMPLLFSCQQRDYSVYSARSTPHHPHGAGLSGVLKSKLNNLGVWARQKCPSVICQLKPIPGRHFACSSKITVVGQTWLDGALRILGAHILPILQTTVLLS